MKIIYKIHRFNPETNRISVSFCNLKSRKPIDEYKSYAVDCDDLDLFDIDSFSESLANKSGVRRIEKQESKLETIGKATVRRSGTDVTLVSYNLISNGYFIFELKINIDRHVLQANASLCKLYITLLNSRETY